MIVSEWPRESLDKKCSMTDDIKEFPDSFSELMTAPLITQTQERGQRHTDEVESKAVGTLHHNQSRL